MTWVRIEDTFPEHPKIDKAGGDAGWLHVCALAYCNRNETDGFIASDRIARLSDRRSPRALAAKLVDAGLWEIDPEGWRIHDYLHYQPSRESLDQKRADARERMAKARGSSTNVRANNERTSREQSAKFAKCSPNPDPTRPDPYVQVTDIPTPVDTPSAGVDTSKLDTVADNYARIALQQANGINNRDAYARTARKTALEHPDIGRYIARWPTAPADAIAAWLHGDKHSMGYYHDTIDDEVAPVHHIHGETT